MRAKEFLKESIGSAFGDLLSIPYPPKSPTAPSPITSKKIAPKRSLTTPSTSSDKYVSKEAVRAYLSNKMDANHVAGIMANIQAESGFRPGVLGDNNTSGGLFQHHDVRFTKMINAAGGQGKWQSNWKGQIDFALSEPAGKQYLSLRFNSPEQASRWWTINFEIPKDKMRVASIRSRSASRFA